MKEIGKSEEFFFNDDYKPQLYSKSTIKIKISFRALRRNPKRNDSAECSNL